MATQLSIQKYDHVLVGWYFIIRLDDGKTLYGEGPSPGYKSATEAVAEGIKFLANAGFETYVIED